MLFTKFEKTMYMKNNIDMYLSYGLKYPQVTYNDIGFTIYSGLLWIRAGKGIRGNKSLKFIKDLVETLNKSYLNNIDEETSGGIALEILNKHYRCVDIRKL